MQDILESALKHIARDVDSAFDAMLPMPGDARARLVEAMRYATIGGGKRVRPLLLTATAELYGVDRSTAIRTALVTARATPAQTISLSI